MIGRQMKAKMRAQRCRNSRPMDAIHIAVVAKQYTANNQRTIVHFVSRLKDPPKISQKESNNDPQNSMYRNIPAHSNQTMVQIPNEKPAKT